MPTIAPPEQGYTPLPAGGAATGAGVPPVQIPQTVPGAGPTPPAQPGNQPGPAATPVPTTQVPGAGGSSSVGGLTLADMRLPTVDELRQLPGQLPGAFGDVVGDVAGATVGNPDFWIDAGLAVATVVAVGAICVGTAGIGCAVMAGIAVGAVAGGAGYAMKQSIHQQQITAGGLATNVALGAGFGVLGGATDGTVGRSAVKAITGKLGKRSASSGVTRVFRVESPRNARLSIDGAGNVGIKGDQTLVRRYS